MGLDAGAVEAAGENADRPKGGALWRKILSCGQSQELSQLADLASDWLFTLVQPIRSPLTQLLT